MVYQGNNLPLPLLFAAMALGSIAAGALWGFIPAWFKARWNTNETLFTLMMNYVATSSCRLHDQHHAREPQASNLVGVINKATKAGWFPVIFGPALHHQHHRGHRADLSSCTPICAISKQGYEIAVVGESENTARYAGINVRRVYDPHHGSSPAPSAACAGFLLVAGKRPHHLHRHPPAGAASRPSSWRGWPSSTPSYMVAHLVPAGFPRAAARRRSPLQYIAERVRCRHHHRHHPVLHSGQ